MILRLILAFWAASGLLCAQTERQEACRDRLQSAKVGHFDSRGTDRRAGCGSDPERSSLETRGGVPACVLQRRWFDGSD